MFSFTIPHNECFEGIVRSFVRPPSVEINGSDMIVTTENLNDLMKLLVACELHDRLAHHAGEEIKEIVNLMKEIFNGSMPINPN